MIFIFSANVLGREQAFRQDGGKIVLELENLPPTNDMNLP
jgi:hypothetical protein